MSYLKPVFKKLFQYKIGEVCLNLGYITKDQLDTALEEQKKENKKIGQVLIDMNCLSQEQLEEAQSQNFSNMNDEQYLQYLYCLGISKSDVIKKLENHFAFQYIDLRNVSISPEITKNFKMEHLKLQEVIPFHENNTEVHFAMADILNKDLVAQIKKLCNEKNLQAKFFFSFKHEIENKFREIMIKDTESTENTEENATEWVDKFIEKGITWNASDIHIEPGENILQVRYRIDGLLSKKEIHSFTNEFIQNILSRIKISSGMDIAEKRKPQDGRIDKFKHKEDTYDLRVSTILTTSGEKLVIRIFNKSTSQLSFSQLGFPEIEQKKISKILHAPAGIIFLAGTTGSGKTTTMYSMIDYINSDEINICSVEDPVERDIKGVNQVQINEQAGITYPAVLKAFLRQDPDIIMVGEIRDEETARLSVQAALTGHLVISTVHTNSALETISRLRSMQIEPYMLSATSLGFVSQKLVRILCDECKKETTLNPYEKSWVKEIEKKYQLEETQETYFAPVGCPKCNGVGFKGRTAIVEIVEVDEKIKKMVVEEKEVCEIQNNLLSRKHFAPLDLNAYFKARTGITTVSETLRVV